MAKGTFYSVHKQMYPATHNFRDEADGASGSDIDGFQAFSTDDTNGQVIVIASEDGHRKVLKISGDGDVGGDTNIYLDNQAETDGTIEIWVKIIDHGVGIIYFTFFGNGAAIMSYGYINCTTMIWYTQHGNGAGGNTTVETAVVSDQWIHYKWEFDCATDTQSVWIDGNNIFTDQNFQSDATYTTYYRARFRLGDGGGANALEVYFDAFGYSWDANYNIGDNVHWRHYKESTDSFEGDDVGTQGTSITWVDTVDTAASFEIVQEFNEHKKVLRGYYSSAVGGYDYAEHNFATQNNAGWFECFMHVSDATPDHMLVLMETGDATFGIRILGDKFYFYGVGPAWAEVGLAAADSTWYHVYIQWYADNTHDIWINNVLYQDGIAGGRNQTVGINRIMAMSSSATEYLYVDAPMSSLDSDVKADNRTLDYNATYTKENITADINVNPIMKDEYGWAVGSIKYYASNVLSVNQLLQLYNENGELEFEGSFFMKTLGDITTYIFHDLNRPFLERAITYAASAAEDANATFLGICTNVGQVDGRCIYHAEHDPAGNRTPNYRGNKAFRLIAAERAAEAGSMLIIKPNGVIFLDDDAVPSSGPYTITDASTSAINIPMIDEYDAQINHVLIKGAMDPLTGAPYYGLSEDATAQAVDGIIRYTRRFYDLQSDADCLARAVAIRTGVGFAPKTIAVPLLSVYGEPGQVINFASALKSLTAANCYIESVVFDLMSGLNSYVLNTGLLSSNDAAMLQLPPEAQPAEAGDAIRFKTEIRLGSTYFYDWAGATDTGYGAVQLNAVGEAFISFIYLPPEIDTSRKLKFYIPFARGDVNNDVIDMKIYIFRQPLDGVTTSPVDIRGTSIAHDGDFTFPASVQDSWTKTIVTVDAADLSPDCYLQMWITLDEAGRDIFVYPPKAEYYGKRGEL